MNEERALKHMVPGELLATMEKTMDPMQIFMFSAVTWNRHLIHYHPESAKGEGHRDVVVQRLLFANFFEQYVKHVFGHYGELSRLSWKIVRSACPGDRLIFQGEVVETVLEEGRQVVACGLRILNDASEILSEASVRIMAQADYGEKHDSL